MLRRVKQKLIEPAEANTIEHLGVDDWAWRKGQNYGTILVDLDLHRVVDFCRIDRLKALRRGSASTALSQQSHVIAAESTQTALRLALLMRSRLPIVSILS